jgi:hypothetical protein
MDLVLPLNKEYFEQIKSGSKTEEYRLRTPFWRKRIEGKPFDRLVITKGYPKRSDSDRRLVFPWNGYAEKTITHPFFGEKPVDVFAIVIKAR